MKRLLIVPMAILAIHLAADAGAALTPEDIAGRWVQPLGSYEFSPPDTICDVSTDSAGGSATFRFELVPLGERTLVRYGHDPADTASCRYLMVEGLTDSTATFARGTPFARGGTGAGLVGSWTYAEGLTIITWTFDRETAAYTHQSFDLDTGALVTRESHTGSLLRGEHEDAGRFFVTFGDGTEAVLFPLIAGDVMYLFDLTPQRSRYDRSTAGP